MYFTAKSHALMTEAVPSAGSIYGYARHALGPFAGFMGGAGRDALLDYLLIPAYVCMSSWQWPWARWCRRWIGRCGIVALGAATLSINWFGVRVTSGQI